MKNSEIFLDNTLKMQNSGSSTSIGYGLGHDGRDVNENPVHNDLMDIKNNENPVNNDLMGYNMDMKNNENPLHSDLIGYNMDIKNNNINNEMDVKNNNTNASRIIQIEIDRQVSEDGDFCSLQSVKMGLGTLYVLEK